MIIHFILGIDADGVDAGVGVVAGGCVVFGVTGGEGVNAAGGSAVFSSPDTANNEKPGVSDSKYNDALSSLIFEVGNALQLLSISLYLFNVIVVSSMSLSFSQVLFTLNSMVAFVIFVAVRLVVVMLK